RGSTRSRALRRAGERGVPVRSLVDHDDLRRERDPPRRRVLAGGRELWRVGHLLKRLHVRKLELGVVVEPCLADGGRDDLAVTKRRRNLADEIVQVLPVALRVDVTLVQDERADHVWTPWLGNSLSLIG